MRSIFYISAIIFLLAVSCSQQRVLSAEEFVDLDLDGVHDERDACPNEPGSLFNLGCPEEKGMQLSTVYDSMKSTDSDLDGVPDEKDECPEQYGSPFNQGCPYLSDVLK